VGAEANVGVPSYQDAQATPPPDDNNNDNNNNADNADNNNAQAGANGSASENYNNDYLVNQVVETALDNGGQIEDMTVSMMINSRELTPDTLEKYKEMVAYGVGISTDKVFITYAEFLAKPETPVYADPDHTASPGSALALPVALPTEVLLYGGAGLGGLILLLVVLLLLRRRSRKRAAAKLAAVPRPGAEGAPVEGAGEAAEAPVPTPMPTPTREKKPIPGEIVLSETREQALTRQVKEFTAINPDIVAQLLRAWMREEGPK
jgi:flagellar M-ring protein FliF